MPLSNPFRRSAWPAMASLLIAVGCTEGGIRQSQADFYSTRPQARIYALDSTSFEVVPPIGAQGAAYWCGAADYARRRLGAGWSQEIYVQSGRADSQVTGRIDAVTFTLEPVARTDAFPSIRRAFGFKPGDHFSLSTAEGFCHELEPILFF